jgi:hypothetical protein
MRIKILKVISNARINQLLAAAIPLASNSKGFMPDDPPELPPLDLDSAEAVDKLGADETPPMEMFRQLAVVGERLLDSFTLRD